MTFVAIVPLVCLLVWFQVAQRSLTSICVPENSSGNFLVLDCFRFQRVMFINLFLFLLTMFNLHEFKTAQSTERGNNFGTGSSARLQFFFRLNILHTIFQVIPGRFSSLRLF